MRAVSYSSVGGPLELLDVPEPDCPPDGAVVRVEATGICRSDWHAWRGHDPVPLPMVPGHEFAGTLAAVGPEVVGFAVGDSVTVPFVNGCGRCAWCLAGDAQVCPDQTQPGFTHPGSYAELVQVRAADFNLVRLPDAVDAVTAASLGCRFATSYHALTRQSSLSAGQWLAVYGCGGVGASAILIAKALGARVVAVDPSPAARERATSLGADHVLASADVDAVLDLTGGGAHVSIDALGSGETASAAVRSLRRRGRHVQVGLMLGAHELAPLPWGPVISRELEVVGSHGMAAADYPELLALVADGRLDPRRLIGRVVSLDDAPAELAAMDSLVAPTAGLVVATVP
ncbi:MAG: zinc-dependent alcohol dehydrogenase family protein [Propionibacteriaceae bacterium]